MVREHQGTCARPWKLTVEWEMAWGALPTRSSWQLRWLLAAVAHGGDHDPGNEAAHG